MAFLVSFTRTRLFLRTNSRTSHCRHALETTITMSEAVTVAPMRRADPRPVERSHDGTRDTQRSGTHSYGPADDARAQCWRFARSLYPSSTLREAPTQGYCSYTLHVDGDTILQFRPWRHHLDLEIASAARDTFGELVPRTQLLGTVSVSASVSESQSGSGSGSGIEEGSGDANDDKPFTLLVYSLSRIPGVPLSSVLHPALSRHHLHQQQPPSQRPPRPRRPDLEPLVRSLAHLHAAAYASALPASSPLLLALKRRVGRTLRWRLELMHAQLPGRFRPVVGRVLGALGEIESRLPWALTHGDLVPGNVMVDVDGVDCDADGHGDAALGTFPAAGDRNGVRLTGLIDWAEAEYLPFGVGLYGLEELLGASSGGSGRSGSRYPPRESTFAYLPEAAQLRRIFWQELCAAIPELGTDAALRARVEDARLLGLLLWYVTCQLPSPPFLSLFPL